MFHTVGRFWKRTRQLVTGAGLDNDATLKRIFGGVGETVSGVEVTERNALTLSAFYAGLRLISWSVAQLPIKVYRRESNGDKTAVDEHPVQRLLQKRPNPDMTAMEFRSQGQSFVLLWGKSISYIERDGTGQPVNLWPLHARDVQVETVNRELRFDISRVTDPPTDKRILFPFEVLAVPGFLGKSIVECAREQLGEAIASQQFGGGFFAGGAQPVYALKHPSKLGDDTGERLRKSWSQVHGGVRRRVAVLEEDMSVETIGMPLKDAQFLESRQFHVTEIARWFGVPPHKLRDLMRATFSNIHEQKLEWLEDLLPHLIRWEQEYNRKLFTEAEQESGLFVEHVVEGFLKGDIEKRFNAYSTALNWGFMNRNEVRRRENLNSLGPEGDVYMVPMNMQDAAKLTEEPEPPPALPPPPGDDDEPEEEDESAED